MQKYSNSYAGRGGQPIAGASVLVKNLDGTAATIYSDNGKTVLASLITAKDGSFGFYAANGRYTITLTKQGLLDEIVSDVLLYDPADAAARALNVQDFGVKGDGVTDDTLALRLAYAAGGDINHPAGTYLVSNTLLWTLKADTRLHFAAGAVIKAATSFPVDNKLVMPSCDGSKRALEIEGGTFDGRLMPARAVGAPDLMYIADANFRHSRISGARFICNDDQNGVASDSGLFLAEGMDFEVSGCYFQGCTDSGIYISGNNALTSGRRAKIHSNTFLYCGVAIISKRVFEDHVIADNMIESCINGIVIGGEGSATQGAGRKAVISGNYLRHVQRGIESRLADGTVISGNRIEDFGMDYTGAAVNDHAILIAGSNKCTVVGNNVSLSSGFIPNSSSAGVLITTRTFNGTTYATQSSLVSGNVISEAARGIYEDVGCDQNMITTNMLASVASRITVNGAKTIVYDVDPSTSVTKLRIGASGAAAPVAGATQVIEDDQGVIINYLTPATASVQWIIGDSANSAMGRMGYDHVTDRWTWRAGGSGIIFELRSDGPAFGVLTASADAAVTGYITIRDAAGTQRKLAVIA